MRQGKTTTKKIPPPKEITLHVSVAKTLGEHCLPDWRWTHVSLGARGLKSGSILKKNMGRHKGWPDFILVSPAGKLHCLELKRIGGKLTTEQREFQGWCIIHGVPYVVAYCINHAMIAFERWGCVADPVIRESRDSGV